MVGEGHPGKTRVKGRRQGPHRSPVPGRREPEALVPGEDSGTRTRWQQRALSGGDEDAVPLPSSGATASNMWVIRGPSEFHPVIDLDDIGIREPSSVRDPCPLCKGLEHDLARSVTCSTVFEGFARAS